MDDQQECKLHDILIVFPAVLVAIPIKCVGSSRPEDEIKETLLAPASKRSATSAPAVSRYDVTLPIHLWSSSNVTPALLTRYPHPDAGTPTRGKERRKSDKETGDIRTGEHWTEAIAGHGRGFVRTTRIR